MKPIKYTLNSFDINTYIKHEIWYAVYHKLIVEIRSEIGKRDIHRGTRWGGMMADVDEKIREITVSTIPKQQINISL